MEYPKRKPNRLTGFDYSSSGAYFITVCIQNRECILSDINVGDGFPVPHLTQYGIICDNYINLITDKFSTVFVDKYVIMPNHIHILLVIQNPDITANGTGNPSPTLGNAVGWLKYQITRQINATDEIFGRRIFQRSYYDHIIRNKNDFRMIWKYIDENPLNWENDCFYI